MIRDGMRSYEKECLKLELPQISSYEERKKEFYHSESRQDERLKSVRLIISDLWQVVEESEESPLYVSQEYRQQKKQEEEINRTARAASASEVNIGDEVDRRADKLIRVAAFSPLVHHDP